MMIRIACFTDAGEKLAGRLAGFFGSAENRVDRIGREISLPAWTEKAFSSADALIFVGAAGIAVRAIAPHLVSKAVDPAVLVVDETGTFVIPILSGHIGGANELARQIAREIGAQAVLTTATDRREVFAADAWAARHNAKVLRTEIIRKVSGTLLAGGEIFWESDFPMQGSCPEGVRPVSLREEEPRLPGVRVTIRKSRAEGTEALVLVPRIVAAGIGCRRGTTKEEILEALAQALSAADVLLEAVGSICSIDWKKDEPGLAAVSRELGVPFVTFTAEELKRLPGEYAASAFVEKTVGVDNVCERSAVLGAFGEGGPEPVLLRPKTVCGRVTVALAAAAYRPDFSWHS